MVLSTSGDEVRLTAGTPLSVKLLEPLTVVVPSRRVAGESLRLDRRGTCSRQQRLPRSIHSYVVDHVLGAPACLASAGLVTRDTRPSRTPRPVISARWTDALTSLLGRPSRHFSNRGYSPLVLLSLLADLAELLKPCPEWLELLLQGCQVLG